MNFSDSIVIIHTRDFHVPIQYFKGAKKKLLLSSIHPSIWNILNGKKLYILIIIKLQYNILIIFELREHTKKYMRLKQFLNYAKSRNLLCWLIPAFHFRVPEFNTRFWLLTIAMADPKRQQALMSPVTHLGDLVWNQRFWFDIWKLKYLWFIYLLVLFRKNINVQRESIRLLNTLI